MGAPQDLIAGRYRLQRRIAAGGMGVVWEARDELLQRTVAVKQLRTQVGVSEDEAELAKQRAMREARITARLHHPHAVPVFDTVEHDGEPCLVMQYVPSEPLSTVIKQRGALPAGEVARIGAEVAAALSAAHALGIVHRDVKPGNILIADEDGSALLSDFGISHALGDPTITSAGFVHGTPAYLAPEVARGDDSTFASDVFSLGSTLYAAAEGTAPFGETPNSIAVLHRVASGGFQAPTRGGPLSALLLQMMASDPEARPTMGEIARRLAAVHAEAEDVAASTLPLDAAQMPDPFDDPDQPTAWVPLQEEREDPATLVVEAVPATEAMGIADDEAFDAEPVGAEPAAGLAAAGALGSSEAGSLSAPTLLAARTVPPVEPPAVGGGDPPPPGRGRRTALVVLVIAVVLIALVVGGLLLALRAGSSAAAPTRSAASVATTPSTTPPPSAAPSSATPTPTSTPTATSTPTPTATPTSTPSPTSTPTATATSSANAGSAVAAIQRYYTLVPRNTSAAWPLMTAAYQSGHAEGRTAYDAFWAKVASVSASNVRSIGTNSVEATITYRRTDGSVSVEDTTFRLALENGVLKIADSAVD